MGLGVKVRLRVFTVKVRGSVMLNYELQVQKTSISVCLKNTNRIIPILYVFIFKSIRTSLHRTHVQMFFVF